jgi:tetratricopeptide (TPR) repeat protein
MERLAQGKHQEAIAELDQALNLKPGYTEAFCGRGLAYAAAGDDGRAIADLSRAIALDSNSICALAGRAAAYLKNVQRDAAIADYTRILTLRPDSVQSYIGRAMAYGAKGVYDRAIADFNRAIDLDPSAGEAYLGRAIAFYYTKKYDQAWEDVTKAEAFGSEPTAAFLQDLQKASGGVPSVIAAARPGTFEVSAAIVQANTRLFRDGTDTDDYPAQVVFSLDPKVKGEALRKLGPQLYTLKNTSPKDPAQKAIVDDISDERYRPNVFVQVPRSLSDSDKVYVGGLIVYRGLLPKRHLGKGSGYGDFLLKCYVDVVDGQPRRLEHIGVVSIK